MVVAPVMNDSLALSVMHALTPNATWLLYMYVDMCVCGGPLVVRDRTGAEVPRRRRRSRPLQPWVTVTKT